MTKGRTHLGPAFALRFDTLDGPSAADEVHDDGDQRKDEEQMNEEAAHVQDEEAAEPEQDQHHSQNEKHE
jgi:hypothetical protein